MSFLFTVILLAISGYVLYSAITAKGKLFSVENIKKEKVEQFVKLLRPIYAVLGVIMLFMALISGYQNLVFSENTYRFTEDFETYYADVIQPNGDIDGVDANVQGIYSYTEMSTIFSTLETPEVPEGVSPQYAEAIKDENGSYVFLGVGETSIGQNETYTSLRAVLPYQVTQILSWILMGLSIAIVIGVFVLMNRYTDKEKAEKAKRQAKSGGAMPASAFEFSDEDSDNSKNSK